MRCDRCATTRLSGGSPGRRSLSTGAHRNLLGQAGNHINGHDQTAQPITAVTLARAKDGRLVELQHLVSDQYAVDDLWSRML